MKFIKCWNYPRYAEDGTNDPYYVSARFVTHITQWGKNIVEVRTTDRTMFARGSVDSIIVELESV